jgi:glycosyltransferase involved in cell wall biosynthesis
VKRAIDIMIPYWGDPGLLMAAVDSVLAQDSPDWHLTVVDDAYADPTASRAIRAIDDPRVTYVRNPVNLGITGNFRRCVELAHAEFAVILGSDDRLLPNYVSTVGEATARYPRADIVQVGVRVVGEDGTPHRGLADTVKQRFLAPPGDGPVELEGEQAAVSLLRGDWLYWPSLALRRDLIARHDFRDGFPFIQDLAMLIDLVLDGAVLLRYPGVAFEYRRHVSSASEQAARRGDRFEGEGRDYQLAARLMREAGWAKAERTARRRTISRLHALSALPRAVIGGHGEAVRHLARHVIQRGDGS